MAAYGSAIAFAKALKLSDAQALLQQTFDEEKQADAKLSEIAKKMVNPAAMMGGGAEMADMKSGSSGSSNGSKTSARKSN